MIELNRIYNMDCLEGMKLIPDGTVDLIVTDPPYLLENSGGGLYKTADKQYIKELQEIKDGFDIRILDECCRVMKAINIYLWCSQKQIPLYIDYFVKGRGCNWNLLTWHKTNPIPACGNKYVTDTEYCLFFRDKGVKLYGNVETKATYYLSPLNTKDKRQWHHPTIKPLAYFQRHIINSSGMGGGGTRPVHGKWNNGSGLYERATQLYRLRIKLGVL
jgi:site-specific DNA-methyltransferase (adenine-specific)